MLKIAAFVKNAKRMFYVIFVKYISKLRLWTANPTKTAELLKSHNHCYA